MPVNMDPGKKSKRQPSPSEADSSPSKKESTVPTQATQFGEETEEDRVKALADAEQRICGPPSALRCPPARRDIGLVLCAAPSIFLAGDRQNSVRTQDAEKATFLTRPTLARRTAPLSQARPQPMEAPEAYPL